MNVGEFRAKEAERGSWCTSSSSMVFFLPLRAREYFYSFIHASEIKTSVRPCGFSSSSEFCARMGTSGASGGGMRLKAGLVTANRMMAPNSTPHADARASAVHFLAHRTRAGERGR
jgi:hypothetical protein